MGAVPIDQEILEELVWRKAGLIQAITAAAASGAWEAVMAPFDDLLGTIARIEEALAASGKGPAGSGESRT